MILPRMYMRRVLVKPGTGNEEMGNKKWETEKWKYGVLVKPGTGNEEMGNKKWETEKWK